METSKSLGIIGIILGLVGAILGGYVFFDNTIAPLLGLKLPASSIKNYYDHDDYHGFIGTDPETLDVLVIFTVSENTDVYIMFICYAYYDNPTTIVEFDIAIDGIIVTPYTMRVSGGERDSVSMQHFTNSLSSGSHNVSVIAEISALNGWIYASSLFVQTIS